jgi:catechol 2,3-dioxygenase-like lactoylglutathione lyase family enzyme
MRSVGVDHTQLAMPAGRAEEARTFYSRLLGLPEILKPLALARRGGTWSERDRVKRPLGVEAEFRPAPKAHPSVQVEGLQKLVEKPHHAGHEVAGDGPRDGYPRVSVSDPFGHHIRLMERHAAPPSIPLLPQTGGVSARSCTARREVTTRGERRERTIPPHLGAHARGDGYEFD